MGMDPVTIGLIGGAVTGGMGGAEKDKVSQSSTKGETSWLELAGESEEEKKARGIAFDSVTSLNDRIKQLESSPVLANLEKLLSELGQDPSAERISAANKFADSVFSPQQEALNQSFEQQAQDFSARAAQMGRSSSDPIMAARLAQEQIRQQRQLSAERGSFAAQEAINAPSRQFQNQLSGISGLAQNAIQNRQAVFSLGSEFANTQMNFRLATAKRFGNTTGWSDQVSGGGFKGLMTGLAGGGAAGAKIGGFF